MRTIHASLGNDLTLLLTAVFGMLLLSLALIGFFVLYQRRLFEQERERREEALSHQRELLSAAIEVQENERRRIASDLHDEIGSLLTATRLYLRQLNPQTSPERIQMIREQSLEILDSMIGNARRITHQLLPPALEKFGLQAALEDLCDKINGSAEVAASFITTCQTRVSPDVELSLYRVVQELISNTLKHAGAQNIRLEMDETPTGLQLMYRDDGRGYDVGRQGGRGLGLRNIESRIALIDGTVRIDSTPGQGFKVVVDIPLQPPACETEVLTPY